MNLPAFPPCSIDPLPSPTNDSLFPYIYHLAFARQNHRCRILIRGSLKHCLVEFEDGETLITTRNALRLADRRWFNRLGP